LGKSIALELARLQAAIAICGRRADVLKSTADELARTTDAKVFAVPCDVRDAAQVDRLFDQAWQHFGRLDGLVNNAAGNFICPSERLSPNAFKSIVDIVLMGTAHCSLAAGKRWIQAGIKGVMLNMVTTYASTGSGFVAPSAAAKGGVLALTRSLAVEWGKHGIRANAIAPGPFPTEGAWSRLFPPELAGSVDLEASVPLRRVGRHEELAHLAAYLLSDYAAYITGDCITIDGGQWLKGAGQFSFLDAVTSGQWDAYQAEIKRKRT
jgi:NAD(P)-dependent dehydrogenase (short-subunit alcohol dehydrogenase family)